jgi:hypothetical protein
MAELCYEIHKHRDPASFRDPSGFVFEQDGVIYRMIDSSYMVQYKQLMASGLYAALIDAKLMIPHEETDHAVDSALIIRPEQVPYISYPYEWCFEQYKDAALTTLRVELLALQFGMALKDASAYNMQFIAGCPKLIDTLSFDKYSETPWTAYGQFCRHFLAPLALMAHVDLRLNKMMQSYIDGIPIDLADTILRGKGGFASWQHIHLHAKAIKACGQDGKKEGGAPVRFAMKKPLLESMLHSLVRVVQSLKPKNQITEWGDYYSATNYNEKAALHKGAMVKRYLEHAAPVSRVWDLGANDGRYSRLAQELGASVIAFDIDPSAVSRNYLETRRTGSAMLPLLLDLSCPSPAIGFGNRERKTIGQRQKPEVILMLAVIHHLAISNNLPLQTIAEWLSTLCEYLIIEFVPKEDSQVQVLLKTRVDIFTGYTAEGFEGAFSQYFQLCEKTPLEQSKRTLYLFKKPS